MSYLEHYQKLRSHNIYPSDDMTQSVVSRGTLEFEPQSLQVKQVSTAYSACKRSMSMIYSIDAI
jgi:hypothetical protein